MLRLHWRLAMFSGQPLDERNATSAAASSAAACRPAMLGLLSIAILIGHWITSPLPATGIANLLGRRCLAVFWLGLWRWPIFSSLATIAACTITWFHKPASSQAAADPGRAWKWKAPQD